MLGTQRMRIFNSSIGSGLQSALLGCVLALGACSSDSSTDMLAAAKKSIAANQYPAAIVQLKSALEKNPQAAEIRYLLGQTLLDAGNPSAAEVELSKVNDQGYERDKVVPALAQALLQTGEYKKLTSTVGTLTLQDKTAEASLKTSVAAAWAALGEMARSEAALKLALAASPDYGPAKLFQALSVASRGDFGQALAMVDRILADDPKLNTARMLKGELQARRGDDSGADETFRKVLELQPAYEAAHMALIGRPLIRGDIAAAEAQWAKMKVALPGQPATMLAEAQIAFVKNDFARARTLAQQLLRTAPDNLAILLLSGAVEAQFGSLVLAETQFSKALALNPGLVTTRLNLGRVYLRLGQPARALEVVEPMLTPELASAPAHELAAQAQLGLGNAAAAEAEFKRAAAIDPADSRFPVSVAQSKLLRGDSAAGLAELQSLAGKSKDIYADLAIVSERMKRGEYEAALKAIDAIEQKSPKEASVPELRGRVLTSQQNTKAAREAFEQALKIDPKMYSAAAQIAALDIREGKPDLARKRYEASIESDPSNYYPRLALAALQRRTGAPTAAVEATLNSAIVASSNAAAPRLMLIDLLLKERRFKDALAQANNATTALPNDTAVLEAAGRASMVAGNVEQATSIFRRLSNLVPTSALPWLRLADLYKADGRREAAETAFKKAIELEPTNAAAMQGLLELLVNSKREREAIEIGRARQKERPADPSGYLFEAVALVRMKQPDEGIAVLRKCLKAVADGRDVAPVLYTMMAGAGHAADAERFAAEWLKARPDDLAFDLHVALAELRRSEYAKAEPRLARLIAARADNALALNNMAWVLVQTGKPGAVPYAQRAVNIQPEDPVYLDTLASALAAEKQYPKALEVQRQAVAHAPSDNSMRLSLARIALQAGDKALARKELEALQALGAKFSAQTQVTELMKSL